MDFLKKNKTTLLGGVGLIVLLYVYLTYFNHPSAPLTTSDQTAVSSDLLATLSSLHTIHLDNSVFTDPAFVSLSDFGVAIPAQDSGRRNPFAPIGRLNVQPSQPATTTKK